MPLERYGKSIGLLAGDRTGATHESLLRRRRIDPGRVHVELNFKLNNFTHGQGLTKKQKRSGCRQITRATMEFSAIPPAGYDHTRGYIECKAFKLPFLGHDVADSTALEVGLQSQKIRFFYVS